MGIINSIIGYFSTDHKQVENEYLDAQVPNTAQVSDVNKGIDNQSNTMNEQIESSTVEVNETESLM